LSSAEPFKRRGGGRGQHTLVAKATPPWLEQTNDFFSAVVEQSSDGLLVIDAEGIVQFANPAAEALLAGRTANLVGSHLGCPAIAEPVEMLLPSPQGARYVELRACDIQWEGRKASLAGLREVTERKRTERDLRERVKEMRCLSELGRVLEEKSPVLEEILAAAVELLPPGFQYPERAVARIHFAGQNFSTGEIEACESRLDENLVAGGEPTGSVTVGYLPAGTSEADSSFLGEERELLRMVSTRLEHVIERTWGEDGLRQSEEKYRSLFETMVQGVVHHDASGAIVSANPAAARILGLAVDELRGLKLTDPRWHVVREDRSPLPPLEHPVTVSLHTGEEVHAVVMGIHNPAEDVVRWVKVNAVPRVPDGDEANKVVYTTMDDITELRLAEQRRREAQAQFRQAQKMESVGRLAGGVAHDFNNMLSVILGSSELALEAVDPESTVAEDLREIRKAAKRSAALTRQLLTFARQQPVDPRTVDLNEVVPVALKMLGRLIGEDITLRWKPGRNLCPVTIDPAQVEQVLTNLAVNARDSIDGVGGIVIETSRAGLNEIDWSRHPEASPGDYVVLSVSDDGQGMDKRLLGKIFEPFFTTKLESEGTGLGLAMVHGIAEQNGGFVDVASRPGEGATFSVYLPRAAPVRKSEGQSGEGKNVERGSEVILLVEDEPALLGLARRLLEHLGYRVIAAGSPGKALELLENESLPTPDLVVTDVVMPGMNGRDLAEQVVAAHPGMKCLFMSGYSADTIAHRNVSSGDFAFIQKPFTREGLATKVREILDS